MHIKHFTTYIQYEAVKPSGVSAGRWRGMLRWYATRLAEGYTLQDMYFGWQYVRYLV